MARGVRKPVNYTGKAAKIHERVLKLDAELKAAKEELKAAYKEQLKEEKLARQKADKEKKEEIIKLINQSGKTPDEILEMLKQNS
ncbi:MAG TPA: hypothetical protein DD414_11245 [Lachnospiraceae bacterium]|nr:hypothetical protein [Lachnospiraceae bacterium]